MSDEGRSSPDDRRARFEAEALPLMIVVYRMARRLVRHENEAQDLVQETYLHAYRSFDGFKPGTNCKAWLLTILYSIFVNLYRKARREPEIVPFDEQRTPSDGGAADALLSSEAVAAPAVEEALASLPEVLRTVVLLIDVEELSYAEAAGALGCPVGNSTAERHHVLHL